MYPSPVSYTPSMNARLPLMRKCALASKSSRAAQTAAGEATSAAIRTIACFFMKGLPFLCCLKVAGFSFAG